ncbi:28697_t:CDS:1, partial [Racocetra persica]
MLKHFYLQDYVDHFENFFEKFQCLEDFTLGEIFKSFSQIPALKYLNLSHL